MRMSGIKALAAAASLAVLAVATQASAGTLVTVTDVGITPGYTSNIGGEGGVPTGLMLFTAHTTVGGQNVPDLFGFCIDIGHVIYLGGSQNLSFLDTMGDPGNLLFNYADVPPGTLTNSGDPNPLDPSNQLSAITNLVDTGFLLYQADPNSGDTLMREAAIQAAIWQIENPNVTITVNGGGAYETAYTEYSKGNWTSHITQQDKVFTLVSQDDPVRQSFAIGWPQGVPEPATWAMMLVGFGGMGAVLRRNRKATAAVA
jgi:hypothetical protein